MTERATVTHTRPTAGPNTRTTAGLTLGVLIAAITAAVTWHVAKSSADAGSIRPPSASPGTAVAASPTPAQWEGVLGPPPLPDPRHRMLLGTFTALAGQESSESSTEQREAAMGRPYDLELTYYAWTDPFPDSGEATIAAHGQIPVMTWYGPGNRQTLAEINDGQEDAWIRRQAEAIKEFGRPIFLRLMIEMNGYWYRGYSGHPAAFIGAWRRIYGIFARVGASNVIWVWCPNVTPDNWDAYYPGNAYVDVIATDGYNWYGQGSPVSFEQIFGAFLRHFAGRKPLMIAETASEAGWGSAAAYINGMHIYLKDVAGPRYGVIAVCWFDTDVSGSHLNWRLDQTPQAWKAWLALARDPYFGGHGASG
jgi:hypothetical protein